MIIGKTKLSIITLLSLAIVTKLHLIIRELSLKSDK